MHPAPAARPPLPTSSLPPSSLPPPLPPPASSLRPLACALPPPPVHAEPERPALRQIVRPASRTGRIGAALLAGVAVAATVLLDRSGLVAVLAVFVLVVPFEKLFPRHPAQRVRRPGVGTDVSFALAGPLLNLVGFAAAAVVGVLSLAWLPGLALAPLVDRLPGPAVAVLGVVLFDFVVYWAHRAAHTVPLLWRFHRVHHSTETLDWVSGFRSHPFDGVLFAPAFVFLLAAGFGPELAGALTVLQIVVGLFLHANVRWRLRPLHRIVATPDFHHWHHSNEPEARNTNHAALLPLWDQLFGTYHLPADRGPTRYGVGGPVPHGMVGLLRQPFVGLRSDLPNWRRR